MGKSKLRICTTLSTALMASASIFAVSANAQEVQGEENSQAEASQGGAFNTIVVTARKKDEGLLDVPVVVSVYGQEALEDRGVSDLYQLANIAPQLLISEGSGSLGGVIALRGVSSGTSNSSIEQAVSINLDGVQVSSSQALRFGQVDLAAIEVLKGPQALFFGKNSPGGVISIRSADPTSTLEVMGRIGYEVKANELIGEAVVSGPLTDTLGIRIVGAVSDMDGYFRNGIPPGTVGSVGPAQSRFPKKTEYTGRITLLFQPTDDLSVRLKYTHVEVDGAGSANGSQLISCNGPGGLGQGAGFIDGIGEDCALDDTFFTGDIDPSFAAFDPIFGDGVPFNDSRQFVAVGEVIYSPGDLEITSVTGLFGFDTVEANNFSSTPAAIIASTGDNRKRDFSHEFRLASDFAGPVNFLVGAFFQDGSFDLTGTVVGDLGFPSGPFIFGGANMFDVGTTSYSAFGQLIVTPNDQIEIAGGLRWTSEKKTLGIISSGAVVPDSALADDTVKVTNVSPEFTASYRPTPDVMIFGAYKHGFKAGGFNTSATATFAAGAGAELRYNEETVKGGEIGAKLFLLGGDMNLNAAIYHYKYEDLQLTAFDAATLALNTTNAATATVKGIEADFAWLPSSLEGFSLNGSINYNNARFGTFFNGCYGGQTIALGCNVDLDNNGVNESQDFAGRQLPVAPDWTGSIGAAYESSLGSSGLMFGISNNWAYTGRNTGQQTASPGSFNSPRWNADATLRFFDEDEKWELAIIGNNLTNSFASSRTSDVVFTGTGTGEATGNFADLFGFLNRPRSIMFRLTVRPSL